LCLAGKHFLVAVAPTRGESKPIDESGRTDVTLPAFGLLIACVLSGNGTIE
jgi:hypothetical protein